MAQLRIQQYLNYHCFTDSGVGHLSKWKFINIMICQRIILIDAGGRNSRNVDLSSVEKYDPDDDHATSDSAAGVVSMSSDKEGYLCRGR